MAAKPFSDLDREGPFHVAGGPALLLLLLWEARRGKRTRTSKKGLPEVWGRGEREERGGALVVLLAYR